LYSIAHLPVIISHTIRFENIFQVPYIFILRYNIPENPVFVSFTSEAGMKEQIIFLTLKFVNPLNFYYWNFNIVENFGFT